MFRGRRPAIAGITSVLAVALCVVVLAACGGGSGKPDFNNKAVVYTNKGGDLTVAVKRAFVIALDANQSTGFVWNITQKPDPKIVKFTKKAYVAPTTTVPGAPGTERFRFKAKKTGNATFTLSYARPDAPDSPDNLVYKYNVTVK
jgi:inhibitor of cysteine peptidase